MITWLNFYVLVSCQHFSVLHLKFLSSSNFSKYTETYVTTPILFKYSKCHRMSGVCYLWFSKRCWWRFRALSVADFLEELTVSVLICHEDGWSKLLCNNGNYLVFTIWHVIPTSPQCLLSWEGWVPEQFYVSVFCMNVTFVWYLCSWNNLM